jgi:hypothetical protein
VWSDSLAAGAQTWADHLVAIGQDVHSTCCGAFKDYGENLAWRVHGVDALPLLVESWVAEKKDYHGGLFTQENCCNNPPIGHYTQVVWKTTTEIGCGIANGNRGTYTNVDYLVCRYTPPGNRIGQSPY